MRQADDGLPRLGDASAPDTDLILTVSFCDCDTCIFNFDFVPIAVFSAVGETTGAGMASQSFAVNLMAVMRDDGCEHTLWFSLLLLILVYRKDDIRNEGRKEQTANDDPIERPSF